MSSILAEKTLYAKDASGQLRVWEIYATVDATLEIYWGVYKGEMQRKVDYVYENQSGRDIDEQIMLEFNSRVNKQRDKGYVESIEDAMKGRTNALGLPRPMLAQVFSKRARYVRYDNAYVQRKYDGNRCLIKREDDKIIAYSRNGKPIKTIEHITSQIDMPNGTILDGELYCHGEKLQTIVSWIKRNQPNSKKLHYHVYDNVSKMPFKDRLLFLVNDVTLGNHAEVVETFKVNGKYEAKQMMQIFRRDGYEGAILRWGDAPYEDGKRSPSLLKMKEFFDAEYVVTSIQPSKDGWAILWMEHNGAPFKATAPGTVDDKEFVLINKENYIGRKVTIEYAYITADGVPFHPIAKAWR